MKIFNVPGRGQTKENSLNCFGGNVFRRNSYVKVYTMLRIKVVTYIYIYIQSVNIEDLCQEKFKKKIIYIYVNIIYIYVGRSLFTKLSTILVKGSKI